MRRTKEARKKKVVKCIKFLHTFSNGWTLYLQWWKKKRSKSERLISSDCWKPNAQIEMDCDRFFFFFERNNILILFSKKISTPPGCTSRWVRRRPQGPAHAWCSSDMCPFQFQNFVPLRACTNCSTSTLYKLVLCGIYFMCDFSCSLRRFLWSDDSLRSIY